jgi:hypothetical protein
MGLDSIDTGPSLTNWRGKHQPQEQVYFRCNRRDGWAPGRVAALREHEGRYYYLIRSDWVREGELWVEETSIMRYAEYELVQATKGLESTLQEG